MFSINKQPQMSWNILKHGFQGKLIGYYSLLRYLYQKSTTSQISPKYYEPIGCNLTGIYITGSLISKINHRFSHILQTIFSKVRDWTRNYSHLNIQFVCVVSNLSNNQSFAVQHQYSSLKILPLNVINCHKLVINKGTIITIKNKLKWKYWR